MIQGSIVALATPMTDRGAVDFARLRNLVQFHIDQGSDGLVAVGTTGESATLDVSEHCAVIKAVVDYANGRLPVIAGTGANSTSEAISLTRHAQDAGADACLIVTPYYNKPTAEGLFRHHQAISEAVDIPQILYNVPGRTACDMLPETIGRIAQLPHIVGVKEATGDLSRYAQIRALTGPDFAVYSGDDASSREFCLLGGNGAITVTGNVAPKLMHEMLQAAMAGDTETALAIDAKLALLHKHLFIQANPIPVKWALAEMGLIGTGIRLPLTWLSEDCHEALYSALKHARII